MLSDFKHGEQIFCLFIEQYGLMLDVDDDDRFLNAVEHDLVQAPDAAVGNVVFMGKFAGTVDVSDRQRGNHGNEIGACYEDKGVGDGFCIQNQRIHIDIAVCKGIQYQ